MKINLPDNVKYIIDTLNKNGFEAYAVGGCVRDSILHKEPKDWDITTSALPEQVKELFRRTIDTGIAHGTVTVMLQHTGYEVTTYRVDGKYSDGRHPDSVEFTASLREDLRRRDFTINAMAYNDNDGLIDLFEGRDDIEKGLIRCVGNAEERFTEDALRMLRAIRFSAQLGFEIEEDTRNAIMLLAPSINKVSRERIHTELNKILLSANPAYVEEAHLLGLTKYVFTGFETIADRAVMLKRVEYVQKSLPFKYAALLLDLGPDGVKKQLKELKLDNDTVNRAELLTESHGLCLTDNRAGIRHQAARIPAEYENVLCFEEACYRAQGNEDMAEKVSVQRKIFADIKEKKECLSIRELAINGNDLMARGIKPGKTVGEMLNRALLLVLEAPEKNDYDILMEYVTREAFK